MRKGCRKRLSVSGPAALFFFEDSGLLFTVRTVNREKRGHRETGNPFSFSFASVLKQIGH